MSHCEIEPQSSPENVNFDRVLQKLETQIPQPILPHADLPQQDLQQLRTGMQERDGLNSFGRSSRLLMAAITPQTFAIYEANETFWQFAGRSPDTGLTYSANLFDLFPEHNTAALQDLYQRYVLYLILRDLYEWDASELLMLGEPLLWEFPAASPDSQPRFVEFWLNCDRLRVTRMDDRPDEFADLNFAQLRRSSDLSWLENRFDLGNYQIDGYLLLEGCDVTGRESILRLTQLLIDRESVLNTDKFRQVNERLRSLFCARDTAILCVERDRVQIFIGKDGRDFSPKRYTMQCLQGSHFLRAAQADRIWIVSDLATDCQTDCERAILASGIRSMLLIPVVVQSGEVTQNKQQLAGLVGLMSDRPHNFNRLDCQQAKELIPAFTCALRQAIQQRVTTIRNIHASVSWRFLQEAERRSWGLTPEPIVFESVYPLFGISDIRGSSNERNRAIQADLIAQFQLGLAVVEAVCADLDSPLTEQLRLDLVDYLEALRSRITVDAEVSAAEYLKRNLETYFDYFSQCSTRAQAAVIAYRDACNNEHHCVYEGRAAYDRTLDRINTLLRETWERWQTRMQQILPHYCDLEVSDGLDHMIYIGRAIDPNFRTYHLRSLRYEQLRAMCDCARTVLSIQEQYDTTMQVTHLVLVQDTPIDIFHDENTERLFDVKGTRDIRYEIVKKRIDKALDRQTQTRITQPGMLTIVYSTDEEWGEYQQYLRYLAREGWVLPQVESGLVEPLPGVTGLKFARVQVPAGS
jgi:hypothetical protein